MASWIIAIDEGDRVMWSHTSDPLRLLRRRRMRTTIAFWRPRPNLVYFALVNPRRGSLDFVDIRRMSIAEQEELITRHNPDWEDVAQSLVRLIEEQKVAHLNPPRLDGGPGDFGAAGVLAKPKPLLPAGGAQNSWPD